MLLKLFLNSSSMVLFGNGIVEGFGIEMKYLLRVFWNSTSTASFCNGLLEGLGLK